jgi:hypothetical protein
MEKQISNINWYLGIFLDRFDKKNPEDRIETISFFNYHNQKAYSHFQTSYENKERFIFAEYGKLNFTSWLSSVNICIPLSNEKFNQMRNINTSNQVSLKRFLKAFGFDEYII